jgi:hypothetical protein
MIEAKETMRGQADNANHVLTIKAKPTNTTNPNQQAVYPANTTSKPPANQTNRSACKPCGSKTKSGTNDLARREYVKEAC